MTQRKDVERLARSLAAQRLDPEYIKHYLQETYGLDGPAVDEILEKIGVPRLSPHQRAKLMAGEGAKKAPPAKGPAPGDARKPPGQNFF